VTIAVKLDSIKLEGKVILSFAVEKNTDKVAGAIKGVGNVLSVTSSGSDYEVTIKSPGGAKLLDIATAVAKKVGADEAKAADLIKAVAWHGPQKAASKTPVKDPPKKGS
jgi:acetyl-CoA carboxylase carboxyltransferase component